MMTDLFVELTDVIVCLVLGLDEDRVLLYFLSCRHGDEMDVNGILYDGERQSRGMRNKSDRNWLI